MTEVWWAFWGSSGAGCLCGFRVCFGSINNSFYIKTDNILLYKTLILKASEFLKFINAFE